MLVGCICSAGRFATTLAMATLRKHALSGTQSFYCIVVFYLMIYRTDRLLFFFVFTFVNICVVTRAITVSSACYFLALMKLIGDSCLSKKSVWKRALLNPEPVS